MQECTTVTAIEKARHHVLGLKRLKLRIEEPMVVIFSYKTVDRSLCIFFQLNTGVQGRAEIEACFVLFCQNFVVLVTLYQ